MAEVVLFHHVCGLTDGVRAFADELRSGGHTVLTPDLFDGELPATIEDGIALADKIGNEVLSERADRAVADLAENLVYAGFSFGGGQAQRLAQTRAGAAGALLYESFISITAEWSFGPWPGGVPVQIHGMDKDRSSRWKATSTPPASWSRPSDPSSPSCSSTRASSICSPTAHCPRTIRTRRRWSWSGRAHSSTGLGDAGRTPQRAPRAGAPAEAEMTNTLDPRPWTGIPHLLSWVSAPGL